MVKKGNTFEPDELETEPTKEVIDREICIVLPEHKDAVFKV